MVTFFWYLFLLIVCIGMEALTKCFSTLNIFTLFILFFLMNHGIGVPLNFGVNGEQIQLDMPRTVLFRWISSLIIMYICFLIGIISGKLLFGNRNMNIVKYKQELVDISRAKVTSVNKMFILITVIIILFTFSQLWNPNLLIQALNTDFGADDYKAARVAYGEGVNSEGNVVSRIAVMLKFIALPLAINIMYIIKDLDRKFLYLFWFSFATYMLLQLITGQKAAISIALVSILICHLFKTGNCRISINNKIIFYAVVGVLFMLFSLLPIQYMFQYPGLDYWDALSSVVNRLTAETSRTLQLHFYVYPDIIGHLHGNSSFIVSALFGTGQNVDPGRVIRGYVLFGDTTDATGTWNAAFIGAAWADFGYLGVAAESIVVTMLLWFYHQWFLRQRKVPVVVALYATLTVSCTTLTETNFLTTMFTFGLGSSFIFYFLLSDFNKENHTLDRGKLY
jgi:Putative O-antigen polymerase